MGVIEKLKPGDYHVTIISAETYTTFTPLLPCMCALAMHDSLMLILLQLLPSEPSRLARSWNLSARLWHG